MFTERDAQFVFQKQTAFNTVPGTPDVIEIPTDASFQVRKTRNAIDNPAIFKDGIEREFALGNHMVEGGGTIVPNLNFYPWILKMLGFDISTTGAGPYTHVCTIADSVNYFFFEKGVPAGNLFYRYLDLVGRALRWQIPVEGILTCDTELVGSGNTDPAAGTPNATPLDASPSEITGEPGEYANMAVLENEVDIGIISDLGIVLERQVREKRVHNKGGKATELRYGNSTVRCTLDTYFETDALLAKARAGTLTPIKATLTQGADSAEHLLPEVKLEPTDWERSDDGLIVRFQGRSIKKSSADSPIKITVVNGTATY